ncbi:hypothetical protein BDB00DRAFT_818131 [Zychaea mexicana]|uniref:uncharacterized protein n=1 Tax=Zychaea mexicana TaxID=64656 RepID=UPI0022FE07B3|nr:uncharacterized protein BDB00DRAFT_818131 [Zychaea mexicana]KAI9494459.1 hypothetical protein BDB00DRAFT_818131 [Zychaea mexicana]
MLQQVDQYDLSTVVNKDDFSKTVELRQCELEGRSLVAKRPLSPGDIVLVENPRLCYLLQPNCRSSLSPHYTKKLWKSLEDIVQDEGFCPGVPAAMLAYLSLGEIERPKYDFFYYPELSEQHSTVQLIKQASHTAVSTLPEFKDLDADDMARFVLKIYGNAHTVSFAHERKAQTHKRRKERRQMYAPKWGEPYDTSGFGLSEEEAAQQRSMICLMAWGSKFAHACAPNLFLQYEPSENVMVFRAVRAMEPGTVLSFSYLPEDDMSLGGLVCGTTVLRQAKLHKFKFFECACARCTDYDWSRGQDNDIHGSCKQVYYHKGVWECPKCHTIKSSVPFIGKREDHVQQITLAFAALAHGLKPVDEDSLRMIEPYMEDLLHPDNTTRDAEEEEEEEEEEKVPVPRYHWTYGSIHAVLSTYHLKLFPQFFGKGLAERFGMTVKGFNEAVVYLQFLNDHIWTCPNPSSPVGSPMAAFFAGWRILAIVIDTVLQGTQRTLVIRSSTAPPKSRNGNDSDEDSDSDAEEENMETTTELIPMSDEWKQPIDQIIDIVHSRWLPLVVQVFQVRRSPVVDDMMSRINEFVDRVEQVSALKE